jgi:hypothetical protein
MVEDIGGRKFIVTLLIILSSSLLTWFARIPPDVYSYVITVSGVAYITGNVVQKLIDQKEVLDGSAS